MRFFSPWKVIIWFKWLSFDTKSNTSGHLSVAVVLWTDRMTSEFLGSMKDCLMPVFGPIFVSLVGLRGGCWSIPAAYSWRQASAPLDHPVTLLWRCPVSFPCYQNTGAWTKNPSAPQHSPQQTKLPTPHYSKLSQRTFQISFFDMLPGRHCWLNNNAQDVA